jgi:hypothetical protein
MLGVKVILSFPDQNTSSINKAWSARTKDDVTAQYSSASMMVSTRQVTCGSLASGECI